MAAQVTADPLTDKARIIDVQGDSSYATGGYALSASQLAASGGVRAVYGINDGGAIIALWDAANLKVKFITAATGAEVLNASNQSAVTVKLLVI